MSFLDPIQDTLKKTFKSLKGITEVRYFEKEYEDYTGLGFVFMRDGIRTDAIVRLDKQDLGQLLNVRDMLKNFYQQRFLEKFGLPKKYQEAEKIVKVKKRTKKDLK